MKTQAFYIYTRAVRRIRVLHEGGKTFLMVSSTLENGEEIQAWLSDEDRANIVQALLWQDGDDDLDLPMKES